MRDLQSIEFLNGVFGMTRPIFPEYIIGNTKGLHHEKSGEETELVDNFVQIFAFFLLFFGVQEILRKFPSNWETKRGTRFKTVP